MEFTKFRISKITKQWIDSHFNTLMKSHSTETWFRQITHNTFQRFFEHFEQTKKKTVKTNDVTERRADATVRYEQVPCRTELSLRYLCNIQLIDP